MRMQLKRALSGLLALVLLLGICVGGFAPGVSATQAQPQSSNVAQGKSVAFYCPSEVTTGDANYGMDAIKAGLSVLTDGVNDAPNWWVNNGNPYVALKSSVVTGP